MTTEVMIPKMKRISREKRKISIPWFHLILIFSSLMLLIGANFVNFDLKHYILPSGIFSSNDLTANDFITCFKIIPQVPILLFICGVIGRKLTFTTLFLYVFCGLTFVPVFALGGGVSYLGEYGFGYILGYFPAVAIAGKFLETKYNFLNMIIASVCGVIIIHFIGIIYAALIALLRHNSWDFICGWVQAQSGLKIVYDIVLSFVLILIAKYFNLFLKFLLK